MIYVVNLTDSEGLIEQLFIQTKLGEIECSKLIIKLIQQVQKIDNYNIDDLFYLIDQQSTIKRKALFDAKLTQTTREAST